ncbi:MAG: elongation factor G [Ruminococcaceae bacterium]|nr:elongation factor G [Oscillospiraceae bacterium]
MGNFKPEKIRNICFAGHGRSGKTTLCEAMLYYSGGIDRFGSVADGTSVMDYDPEEIKRNFSISTTVAPVEYKDCKINLIDTPGYFDFVGGVCEGMRGADSVVITVSGKSGVGVGTENVFRSAVKAKKPIAMFITKLENEHSDYDGILEQIKSRFGSAVVPFTIPIIEDKKVMGFVDVISQKAYTYDGFKCTETAMPADMADKISDARNVLFEQIAETDEALMEKFFDGEEFSEQEIFDGIKNGLKESIIVPVFAGELSKGAGVSLFMDALISYMPSPVDVDAVLATNTKTEDIVELSASEDGDVVACVFKTVADPYVGKLSIFRVISGVMKSDSTLYNPTKDISEKIGRLYTIKGKKQVETDSVVAGDIGAVTKLAGTTTGDTLCKPGLNIALEAIDYPAPVISLAVLPVAKGDEEKIHAGLVKLREEDPTFKVSNNHETHQMIIEGQGEQHIDVIVSKLKTKYGVSVKLEEPIVPYREAIKGRAKVEGKHKKQSGGHGQYGHVVIEFEPGSQDGLEFAENVFGGSVPKNYFPAVEKGLRDCMEHGVLAGYPVVSLKATLLDGSYHPVDSSEMAFKVAAGLAFKTGLAQANPILLEPIGYLKVSIPENMMGDIIGDINKRRGRILGMGSGEVEAEVPVAEMFKYATDLRSMTQGKGSFSFDFVRYEEAPKNVVDKVIMDAKAKQSE